MNSDPYAAYCFDSAVAEFGRTLEAELNAVTGKNVQVRREQLLRRWLDLPLKFKNPMATTRKK